jgi:hypothetical protein
MQTQQSLTFSGDPVQVNWKARMDRWFAWIEHRPAAPPTWKAAQKLPLDPFNGEPIAVPQGRKGMGQIAARD